MDENDKRKEILKVYNNVKLSSQEKQLQISKIMGYHDNSDEDSDNSNLQNDTICSHYTRGCWVQCTVKNCERFVGCRLCHPEIDRYTITTVKCKQCDLIQPCSNLCINKQCKHVFGTKYFCNICHLYVSDPTRQIFHCDGCGKCRVGTREETFHCDKCNGCFNIIHKDVHNCKGDVDDSCAICREKLDQIFNDPPNMAIINVKCGHSFHSGCINRYINEDYKCPLCRKAMIDLRQHTLVMDSYIETAMQDPDLFNGVPEQLKNKHLKILCNECEQTFDTSFSPFQLYKCEKCNMYNTDLL